MYVKTTKSKHQPIHIKMHVCTLQSPCKCLWLCACVQLSLNARVRVADRKKLLRHAWTLYLFQCSPHAVVSTVFTNQTWKEWWRLGWWGVGLSRDSSLLSSRRGLIVPIFVSGKQVNKGVRTVCAFPFVSSILLKHFFVICRAKLNYWQFSVFLLGYTVFFKPLNAVFMCNILQVSTAF